MPYKNKADQQAWGRRYRKKHKKEAKKHSKWYRKTYHDEILAKQADYRETNRKFLLDKQRNYKETIRQQVWAGYGNKCKCCGETNQIVFQIDHVNGAGTEDRMRALGYNVGGTPFYKYLIKEGFPEYVQILCANCHFAKHRVRECPHETERKKESETVEKSTTLVFSTSAPYGTREHSGICGIRRHLRNRRGPDHAPPKGSDETKAGSAES